MAATTMQKKQLREREMAATTVEKKQLREREMAATAMQKKQLREMAAEQAVKIAAMETNMRLGCSKCKAH